MKMVKSLLLGTAAGLVAVAGAQAADLPVKAKPVQYVKICSLYGAGFYYIPGTDMCLKMGGWVRAEYVYGANGNLAWGWANGNVNDRRTNNSTFRARGYITADARNQSEYGTIRSYIAIGINTNDVGFNNPTNTFSANRAFIQFAGFTFGIAQSFYDFYSVPATAYWGAYPASDTGDPGWMVMAYTMQFGGGFSASISAEERRVTQIINAEGFPSGAATGSYVAGAFLGNGGAYGGFQMPDVVANLRLDQAWGSAQIMGALHQVNATYYGPASNPPAPNAATGAHPSDEYGFAVGAGVKILTPFITPGDYLQAQVNYSEGALRYVFMTPASNWGKVDSGTLGYGVLSDGVYGATSALGANGTSVELTTGWGVNVAYEHFWNKQWKTSAYGGYAEVSYGDLANNMLCAVENNGAGTGSALSPAIAGCNNNWSTWWIGSRTQFNIDPSTYLGIDVLYSKLHTATANAFGTPGGPITGAACSPTNCNIALGNSTSVGDVDNWAIRFRVHRDFYP